MGGGEERSLAHLSSPKVKAKGSGHQKEQKEDTKDEKERDLACFQGTRGPPRALGTYRRSTALGIGSELKGYLATPSYVTDADNEAQSLGTY